MINLAFATFLLVFLRAWQQQNVVHGWYKWAFITSYFMAFADILIIVGAVEYGLKAIPYMGTGGAVGVVCAMLLHKKMRRK